MLNFNCILCPYKHEEDCTEHGKCYSLSNIYYGKLIKWFPFNLIHRFLYWISDRRYNHYCAKMDKKYGSYLFENDDIKFIWGIKSYDDLSSIEPCLFSMNDIDITYDKKNKQYMLGIETAYIFKTYEKECEYLKSILKLFTNYMDENNLNKNERYPLWMDDPCANTQAESIELLYTKFRIFVNGFCSLGDE